MSYTGKLLRIDLTTKEYLVEDSTPYNEKFIGGRGVGDWILFNEVGKDISALDSNNVMIFGTGPLTGTAAPSSGRLCLVTKNFMSGGIVYANVGGHFSPELKYAGFDYLVIKGKASHPVYLYIDNNNIEFRDASFIWGKDVWETEDLIREYLREKKVQILSIGPAGENLVKSACIISNKTRSLSWGGCGAVMGSKNLKAIVVSGNQSIAVKNPDGFMNECYRVFQKMEHSVGTNSRRQGGSINKIRPTFTMQYRNFQDGHFGTNGKKATQLAELNFKKKYEIRRMACFNCPMYCYHFYSVDEGPYKGLKCEGISINAVRGFGSNLDVDDPAFVLECNSLCNRLGLNIDEISSTLGWAFECFERNILNKKDLNGLSLEWGNQKSAIELIKMIAYRKEIGKVLAQGTYIAAKKIGKNAEKYAITIKGTGVNEGGMRGKKAWALGIVSSTRGGGHLSGSPNTEGSLPARVGKERFDVPTAGQATTYEGKAKLVVWFEKLKAVIDSLGVCYETSYYGHNMVSPDDYAALFSKAINQKVTAEDLFEIGEKIFNIEKAFNTLHIGFTRKDDYPPQRLMDEPVKTGLYAGERLEINRWNQLLDEYYALHGWDKKTGWQTKKGLEKLKLEQVSEKLQKEGKLITNE